MLEFSLWVIFGIGLAVIIFGIVVISIIEIRREKEEKLRKYYEERGIKRTCHVFDALPLDGGIKNESDSL